MGASANGQPVPLGTFPVNSVVAKTLGAQPLEAEDSTNYIAGLVWSPGNRFALTLDFYQVDVHKRIMMILGLLLHSDLGNLTSNKERFEFCTVHLTTTRFVLLSGR